MLALLLLLLLLLPPPLLRLCVAACRLMSIVLSVFAFAHSLVHSPTPPLSSSFVFQQAGNFSLYNAAGQTVERYNVDVGTVKFNVEIHGWQWCGNEGFLCTEDQTAQVRFSARCGEGSGASERASATGWLGKS